MEQVCLWVYNTILMIIKWDMPHKRGWSHDFVSVL